MISLAVASFKEAVRKKLFLLVGGLTLVYLTLFSIIVYYFVRDMSRSHIQNSIQITLIASQIISILGFYFSSMLVALLTIMASISSISSEVENGTIHSIITKPVKRAEYILGKYSGLAVLLIIYSIILFTSVLIICAIAKLPLVGSLEPASLIKGFGFFILEPLAILSLSILGSATLKTLTNGIIVISIYILGLIGGMMEQIGSLIKNNTLYLWGIFSSLVSPFDVIYREMLSAIFTDIGIANPFFSQGSLSATAPSKWMLVYIFIYILGLILLACRKFEKRDIA